MGSSEPGTFAAWSWILAHFPPPPGIELHVACLWAGRNERKDFVYQGVHFHLVPAPARGRALLLFARDHTYFRAIYDEVQPQIVHGWGTEDSFGLVARRLAPRRHVIGVQGLIKAYRQRIKLGARSALTQLTESLTLRNARNVVAESSYSARIAQPLCPLAAIHIIEHPLRAEFLQTPPSEGKTSRILYVGAIDERKGISHALRAFSALRNREWSLHIVGSGLPEAESAMRSLAKDLRIEFEHDRVLSAGQLATLMAGSSIFLLPTMIDTGPTALKEGLAMGLWPVCYDNSGPAEYVGRFQFGSLARDSDVEDLSARLCHDILSRPWADPGRRELSIQAARQAFSREAAWQKLVALYDEIARGAA